MLTRRRLVCLLNAFGGAIERREIDHAVEVVEYITNIANEETRYAREIRFIGQARRRSREAASRSAKSRMQTAPTADRIREIQSALAASDSYKGEPNGKWDDASVAAMKHFQQVNGLNPSGKLDALSLQKLGLGSETAGRGAPRVAKPAGSTTSSTTPSIPR